MSETGVHALEPPVGQSRPERRVRKRTPVPYVRCFSPTPGTILNVSERGVCIEEFRQYKRGESVFLAIKLPGRTGRILGHVRWCHQVAAAGQSLSPVFQVGIALTAPIEDSWFEVLLSPGRKTRAPLA